MRQYGLIVAGLLMLAGGIVLLAASPGITPAGTPMDGNVALDFTMSGAPFAANSFWNTLVPDNALLNPNSTDYANEITNQVCYGYATFSTAPTDPTTTPCTTSNISALNTSKWSSPLYVVPTDQPTVNVGAECNATNTAFAAARANVPIPADAHGSGEAFVPTTPTITNYGIAGTASYDYAVASVTADGSSAEPSSDGSTSTGNAILSATNYNIVTWTPVAQAVQYKIYRLYGSGTPSSEGLIGTVSAEGGNDVPQTFNDTGMAATTAVPGSDTDQEITIYQPSTDQEWEFWGFNKDSDGNWQACWGGVIDNVSSSNGIFPNNTGSTATSLPLLGGIPRISEFQAGQINHVMNLSLGENFYRTALPGNTSSPLTCNTVTPPTCTVPANVPDPGNKAYSWPATRNDGSNPSTLAIPEGQRFRLNPNLDLSQYNPANPNATTPLSPMAYTIAVAAQKYGFVVDDRSDSVSIRLPDPTTYAVAGLPNPYTSGPGVGGVGDQGLYEGASASSIMANFPWSQLQALPFNYGDPVLTPPTVSVSSPTAGATVSGTTTVTATASATSPATVNDVQFEADGSPITGCDPTSPTSGSTYSCTTWDTTAVSNGSHTLTAIATDTNGATTTASSVSVSVSNAGGAPSTPTGLTVTAKTPTSVSLSWTAATDTGGTVAGYHVYRNGTLIASPTGTNYTDTGLTPHTGYTYTITAYDTASPPNVSAASAPLPVTTLYEGDINGDGTVNIIDLSILLAHYGQNYIPAEFDGTSTVDIEDLSILLANYGK